MRFYPTRTRSSISGTTLLSEDCFHLDGRKSFSLLVGGDCMIDRIFDSFGPPTDLVSLLGTGLALYEDRFNLSGTCLLRMDCVPRFREMFVGELSS